ncbi:MAG: O-antigen ligase family protein [Saprospiraceae bacterium]
MDFLKSAENKFPNYTIFIVYIGILLLSVIGFVYTQSPTIFAIPLGLLIVAAIYNDYTRLFYGIFMVLPFSMEFYFDNVGLGTDLPSEPLMIILASITLLILIKGNFSMPLSYVNHPIWIWLTLHFFWILVTTLNSSFPVISLKFLLAKIWYILSFFVFPLLFARNDKDIIKAYQYVSTIVFISIIVVLIRHSFEGFSFAASYDVVRPFYRNHVSYASISVICLPFIWAFYRVKKYQNENSFLWFAIIIFMIGIYFSYTRAAILSILIAIGAYFVIKYRYVKHALAFSSILLIFGIIYLAWDNNYMDFAPNYEKTITHTEFDNLIEATYKLEDISSMERVYRWMAGAEMIKSKFWMGFGPGTFVSNYKNYSISKFQTYVSDNPEQSGIHNYYLMTWTDQGVIGFVLFIVLCIVILLQGEKVYAETDDTVTKYYIMATILSTIIILAMSLINDLLETDKVGPFFFLNAALIILFKRQIEKKKPPRKVNRHHFH